MGLFSFLSPSSGAAAAPEEQRAVAVRTGAVAPSRQERARCYVARDAYFACLDAHGIVDSVADEAGARKACGAEDGQFEKDCAAQWVGLLPPPPSSLAPLARGSSSLPRGLGIAHGTRRVRGRRKSRGQCGMKLR
jgi:hypothetical protein